MIGIVAQSGALAAIMRMAFLAKGLGLSHVISTGNEADLTVEDFLEVLIEDRRHAGRDHVRRADPAAGTVSRAGAARARGCASRSC